MITAEHEQPRQGVAEEFSDAVTFAFADADAEVYGMARVGMASQESTASGLAILFSGPEPVAARAEGGVDVGDASWEEVEAAGVRVRVDEPLRRWSTGFTHDDGGFDLAFTALSPALEFGSDSAVAQRGGMEGYEHLCRVEGGVTVAGRRTKVRCLGQRGHAWGAPRWDDLTRATSVSAWMHEDRAFVLQSVLPAGADGHDAEVVTLVSLEPGEDDAVTATALDPRLSTTYDGAGRHRRAGLEYWVDEEGYTRRAAGEAICGTTLELGRLRMDTAFFAWTMEGDRGVGRYEVLRRT